MPTTTVAATLRRGLLLAARPRASPTLSPHVVPPKLLNFPSCPLPPSLSTCSLNKPRVLVLVASSSSSMPSFDEPSPTSKKSILSNLIQEIEPLDVSLIQKDVPANTVDAMKRTISGMLGLLPSDQFNVLVEAFWEPLFKLFVSSMMTGYTLRNAEYRLCLERNLDISDEHPSKQREGCIENNFQETLNVSNPMIPNPPRRYELFDDSQDNEAALTSEDMGIQGLGEMSTEAKEYILYLQSRLASASKELRNVKRRNAALQMQQFVGEEKNDLLDYLRSLQPEKVAELSEPTCPGLQEIIHSVVHGLLATLSPRIHTKPAPQSDNSAGGVLNVGMDDCAELVENTSLQFQPLISVSRDYLARLLFWCMLLGHYLRGLEYRLELMQLLTISDSVETVSPQGEVS